LIVIFYLPLSLYEKNKVCSNEQPFVREVA
jgi:hypothetical protein